MLHFYPSNHTENLASVLAQIMQHSPLSNPFDNEVVLIQSQGMGTWLQQEISKELGVAAMIDTVMPASFVWRLSERVLKNEKLVPRFEKRNLRWELMRVMPGKLNDPRYRSLKHYLESLRDPSSRLSGTEETYSQQHLFQLCDRIADIFDAYQNYRSDWIHGWEENSLQFSDEAGLLADLEAWQADLWLSVYGEISTQERSHRPIVIERLYRSLESLNKELQEQLPERLFIFGLSALPPQWQAVFERLSQYVDIHFLVFNPCQKYWGDIQTEPQQLLLQKRLIEQGVPEDVAAESVYESNPLLASWGRLGRDYVSLLAQSDQISEISVDLYERGEENQTALRSLQLDILDLNAQERRVENLDQSIRFARCHSRLREVEALHDYLLGLMDQDPELEPKDIIVMMPDVQAFAPFVDAVFSRPAYDASGNQQYLPYGISDQLLATDQPLIDVITDSLSLSSKRITSKEVMDWLDIEAIRSRFAIELEELDTIRKWVEQLNIRWGLSANHRKQVLSTDTKQGMFGSAHRDSEEGNTWIRAFHRILAGNLYGEQGLTSDELGSIIPFNLDGRDELELAGKLIHFLDVIYESSMQFSGKGTVSEWLSKISRVWQRWFDEDILNEEVSRLMDKALSDVQEQVSLVSFEEKISFELVAEVVSSQFQTAKVSQRFLAGRANFCTLMPMRSIPFKVVCLIGMNEGEYPRIETKASFDLMSLTSGRVGDRSGRHDDQYLFLEAICSARSNLYISYCGYDIRDNSERFPSVLVSELQEYCDRYFKLDCSSVLDTWTLSHRLQPFHAAYYGEQTEEADLARSYCADWLALHSQKDLAQDADLANSQIADPLVDDLNIVLLEDLVSCANHPLRFFYQNTLRLSFNQSFRELEENEPFALTGLDLHQLKFDLISSWAESQENDVELDDSKVFDYWRHSDKFPVESVAALYREAAISSLDEFKAEADSSMPFELIRFSEKLNVDLSSIDSGSTIEGELIVGKHGQIVLSLSKHVGGQFFGVWVRHVIWNWISHLSKTQRSRNSLLVTPEKSYHFDALDASETQTCLTEIIQWFILAREVPTPFLSKTAFASLFESEAKAKAAFKGFRTGSSVFEGEVGDAYWQRACRLGDLELDASEMPDFESCSLYQQVQKYLQDERIQVRALGEMAP